MTLLAHAEALIERLRAYRSAASRCSWKLAARRIVPIDVSGVRAPGFASRRTFGVSTSSTEPGILRFSMSTNACNSSRTFRFPGWNLGYSRERMSVRSPPPLPKVLLSLLPLPPENRRSGPERPWFWPQSWPQIFALVCRGDLMPLFRTLLRVLRAGRERSQAKLATEIHQ
jgi:hypothetical protein